MLLSPWRHKSHIDGGWLACFFVKSLLHFCKFLIHHNFDLKTDCIFKKPIKRRIQRYTVHMEILSTFYIRDESISVKKKYSIQTNGAFGNRDPHLIHIPWPTQLTTPKMASWSIDALSHNYVTKSPLIAMGRPTITHKTAPSPSTISTASNTPIPQPTPITIPNGIQIQSAISSQYTIRTHRLTDRHRQTHGIGNKFVRIALILYYTDSIWRKQIKYDWWVGECFFWYQFTQVRRIRRIVLDNIHRAIKRL